MTLWARVFNGSVAEIIARDPAGLYHPAIQWVSFDDSIGVAVGWTYDGVNFAPPTVPDLPPPTTITPLDFINRFTLAEQTQIAQLALGNSDILLWLIRTVAATYIDLTDPLTASGMAALVQNGLVTDTREDEILTP